MKSTGIIRRIDDMGRVVFPIEIRRILNISKGDKIEIYVSDNKIIFKKFVDGNSQSATSVTRPLDSLGRTVVPMELRKMLSLPPKAPMQVFVEDDAIILKEYEEKCIFCGGNDGIVTFKDKKVCAFCKDQLSKM